MNISTPRLIFAALCLLGFCAILFGAWWELARFRRMNDRNDSMPRQLRLRLVSAVLWLCIFGALAYAALWLWPTAPPRTPLFKTQAREWALVMASAFLLLFPALVLLVIDIVQTSRERREHAIRFHQEMSELLREQTQQSEGLSTRSDGKSGLGSGF